MIPRSQEFKSWLDQVKTAADAERVAQDLGLSRPRDKGRFFCPACQPNGGKTPDLAVKGGGWRCFKCDRHGDVVDLVVLKRGSEFIAAANWLAELVGVERWKPPAASSTTASRSVEREKRTAAAAKRAHVRGPSGGDRRLETQSSDVADRLVEYQAALPGSLGEQYLDRRRIPLDLALAHGCGYAAPGAWLGREWKFGRLVVPHTDPAGTVVNLYGRTVGADAKVPKWIRHDHLRGPKAMFNAPTLRDGTGPVYVTEGAFDALALLAAGIERAVGLFGKTGWRWSWARDVDGLVIGFDPGDPNAVVKARELAREAILRGRRASILPAEVLGGAGDLAEAWATGTLAIGDPTAAAELAVEWAERAALRAV